jgi:hypothetical protein
MSAESTRTLPRTGTVAIAGVILDCSKYGYRELCLKRTCPTSEPRFLNFSQLHKQRITPEPPPMEPA